MPFASRWCSGRSLLRSLIGMVEDTRSVDKLPLPLTLTLTRKDGVPQDERSSKEDVRGNGVECQRKLLGRLGKVAR